MEIRNQQQTDSPTVVEPHRPVEPAELSPSTGRASAAPRRGLPRAVVAPLVVLVLAVVAIFGYRYWYNATHYVWTDNAQIAGPIVSVGTLNAGQVSAVLTDVGQRVQAGQVVARVVVPETTGATGSGTPTLAISNVNNQTVDVVSPVSGIVAERLAEPGATVAAGQSIVAVTDPFRLYVEANVNETDVDRVQVGQAVDVTVDSLGLTLPGRVAAITPASASTFSLLPQQTTSGNFSKVVQVVPVKIAVDYGNLPLTVGSSVEVNIHIAD